MSLISYKSFLKCVNRYNGDYKTKQFTCWKQFLCMAFGQLTHRESLSDTVLCLTANSNKLYHLGIGEVISKTTLSRANEQRDWRIYADLCMLLIAQAKSLYTNEKHNLEVDIDSNIFAIDATIIDVSLSAFYWAKYKHTRGGVKVHTQLDLKTSIPEFIEITSGSIHEINILDRIDYQSDSFYVVDRGYIDFERFYRIHSSNAFFITRARSDFSFVRTKSYPADKLKGVMCDQRVHAKKKSNFYVHRSYPECFRRIKYYDAEQDRTFVFLTNNFTLKALDIATLYKHRWIIELFFKWIKQHLKIKSFWGMSENAVKTQIWIAISIYVLVIIAKKNFQLKQSIYEILQVFSISIFDKT
ncbi:IS4 family transposase, partial [Pollutibacter soli]|uniref:IS4 family transposase n=1 Tax=Pollutibacter soli TaxID=3034157 RepID=UPI003013D0B8